MNDALAVIAAVIAYLSVVAATVAWLAVLPTIGLLWLFGMLA